MKISFKCLTAGRVHLLEEALQSFLHLYEKHGKDIELIIVNDYPYQTLIYNHPAIKITNNKELFPSIGEKDIFAHDMCQNEVVGVFDDDDIALPNHVDNIRKYLGDNDILHWQMGGFMNEVVGSKPKIDFCGLGNSGIVYPKSSYLEVGKSPIMNAGYDRVLVNSLHALRNKVSYANPPKEDISWLYRWASPSDANGVGNHHLSGLGDDIPGRDDVRIRNFNYLEYFRVRGKLTTGNIVLTPKWKYNYVNLVKDYL